MDFPSIKAFDKHKLCLCKTTEAFICLKYALIPVLKWPNPVVKAFDVLISDSKTLAKHIEN